MVRQAHSELQLLVEPVICNLGYGYVGMEYLPQGKDYLLRIYIDKEDGITVDDCAQVSYQISALLDVEDPIKGAYKLEVSSPGMDRPLFTAAQFAEQRGNKIKLKLVVPREGRRNFKGTLLNMQDETVTLDLDGEKIDLDLNNIEKARLVPEL